MTPPTVTRATPADLEALVPLFEGYLAFYERTHPRPAARAFLAARLANGDAALFVARDADATLGFAQLYPAFLSLALRPAWILEDLFVAPDARRRGAGAALLAAAERFARATGAAELTLRTAVTNADAQRVYAAAGWRRDDAFFTYVRSLAGPDTAPDVANEPTFA